MSIGKVVVAQGIKSLDLHDQPAITFKLQEFDSVIEDDAPYGEQHIGSFAPGRR